MEWFPASTDINPIKKTKKNSSSIIKIDVYKNEKQYWSNEDIYDIINIVASNVKIERIEKLAESMNETPIIKYQEAQINM